MATSRLAAGASSADLRTICTEAGMGAIRAMRDYIVNDDVLKAARKVMLTKKLESKLDTKLTK